MARTKVTVKFQILEDIQGFMNSTVVDRVGGTTVRMAKDMIARGRSPVEGHGTFEAYSDPDKYPGGRKPSKPVNLELDGTMLSYFTFRRGPSNKIHIGMLNAPAKELAKARAHNNGEGTSPERRFIPHEGENWAKPIQEAINRLFEERLDELIRQSNKKK